MRIGHKIKMLGVLGLLSLVSGQAHATTPVGAQPDGTIANQYIITLLKPQLGDLLYGLGITAQINSLLTAVGGGQLLNVYSTVLYGFSARLTPAQAQLLQALPLVLGVEPDFVVADNATQNSPPSYGIDRIDQRVLPLGKSFNYPDSAGQGVHLYIIDGGLNANHTEFTGRVSTSRNFVKNTNGVIDAESWADCRGHGTHVAGIAAGTQYGVAKKATLHAVRVLDCDGDGAGSTIIAGMDWVAQNAVHPAVVNMSIGSSNGRSAAWETAAQNIVNANIAMAVAAGNDNTSACNQSPAAEPAVITVASVDSKDTRASNSNFGTCVDLFAPGVNIVSAAYNSNTASKTLSGTSMASPHVAGVLALMRAQSPNLSALDVQNTLLTNATTGKVVNAGSGSPNKLLFLSSSASGDAAPVASFSVSCSNFICSFNGSTSSDDQPMASYQWSFGDGTSGNGATLSHAYNAAGAYNLSLVVTDSIGQTGTKLQTLNLAASGANITPNNETPNNSGGGDSDGGSGGGGGAMEFWLLILLGLAALSRQRAFLAK